MRSLASLGVVTALLSTPLFADPGTTITYQGILRDSSGPITGEVSLQFALFDMEMGGDPVGAGIGLVNKSIVGGLLVQELDFTADAFTGGDRWLEVALDGDGGVDNFVTLSPRIRVSPAPYAIYAENAGNVDDADADPTNELIQSFSLNNAALSITDAGGLSLVDLNPLTSLFGDGHSLDSSDGEFVDTVLVDNSGNANVTSKIHVLEPVDVADSTMSSDHLYQTFTVEHDGYIVGAGVVLANGSELGRLRLHPGSSQGPTLADSGSGPFTTDGDYTVASFPDPIPVQVGETYTLRASRASGQSFVEIEVNTSNPYPDGQVFSIPARDFRFQIYVAEGGSLNVDRNAAVGGSVTAAQFIGDGSGLTNVDLDSTNELQDLTHIVMGTNREIQITNGASTTISVADFDNDSMNELQSLSSFANGTNREILITGGTGTTFSIADNDNSSTNEFQTLSSVLNFGNDGGGLGMTNVGLISASDLDVDSSTLAVDPTNNRVGIGISSPAATLDVRGDIYFGSTGEYSPVAIGNGSPSRMIWGRIASDGTINAGSGGYTVSVDTDNGNNIYIVDFDPDYSVTPAVTATAEDDNRYAVIRSLNTDFVRFRTGRVDDNNGDPAAFSFIAIGPR